MRSRARMNCASTIRSPRVPFASPRAFNFFEFVEFAVVLNDDELSAAIVRDAARLAKPHNILALRRTISP